MKKLRVHREAQQLRDGDTIVAVSGHKCRVVDSEPHESYHGYTAVKTEFGTLNFPNRQGMWVILAPAAV